MAISLVKIIEVSTPFNWVSLVSAGHGFKGAGKHRKYINTILQQMMAEEMERQRSLIPSHLTPNLSMVIKRAHDLERQQWEEFIKVDDDELMTLM